MRLSTKSDAHASSLGPITRSVLKVDLKAKHVDQLSGALQTCSEADQEDPGRLLHNSLYRHSALIFILLLVSSNSTDTGTQTPRLLLQHTTKIYLVLIFSGSRFMLAEL